MDGLSQLLEASDYVVNVLPSTPASIDLLSGEVLRSCRPGATFVNVGRGDRRGQPRPCAAGGAFRSINEDSSTENQDSSLEKR